MGTYYEIVNLDKKEVICLSSVSNIKSGAFEVWSPQIAIMIHFLGFHCRTMDLLGFEGRWEGDRVAIVNDAEDHEWDEEDWPDAGMLFLYKLRAYGRLEEWAGRVGLSTYGIVTPYK